MKNNINNSVDQNQDITDSSESMPTLPIRNNETATNTTIPSQSNTAPAQVVLATGKLGFNLRQCLNQMITKRHRA